jgi:hypothetical protein
MYTSTEINSLVTMMMKNYSTTRATRLVCLPGVSTIPCNAKTIHLLRESVCNNHQVIKHNQINSFFCLIDFVSVGQKKSRVIGHVETHVSRIIPVVHDG